MYAFRFLYYLFYFDILTFTIQHISKFIYIMEPKATESERYRLPKAMSPQNYLVSKFFIVGTRDHSGHTPSGLRKSYVSSTSGLFQFQGSSIKAPVC